MATNSSRSRTACALRARRTRRCSSPFTPTCSARGADVSGATVYTCSERASDARGGAHRRTRERRRQGRRDRAESARPPASPTSCSISSGARRAPTRTSFRAASSTQLQGAARLNHNPERSAGFVVLKAPDFPSVLVELGYLSNAQDVQAMNSPDWRAKTASAMANAIDRFFAAARSDGERRPRRRTPSPRRTRRARRRRRAQEIRGPAGQGAGARTP